MKLYLRNITVAGGVSSVPCGTSLKILSLGKVQINLALLSTYAYLCIQGFSNGW